MNANIANAIAALRQNGFDACAVDVESAAAISDADAVMSIMHGPVGKNGLRQGGASPIDVVNGVVYRSQFTGCGYELPTSNLDGVIRALYAAAKIS